MEYIRNKKNKNFLTSGFTIIESFVAITVLLIAILGPLMLITKAISDGNYAKNQVISYYLLQEGLDLASARAKQLVDSGNVVDFASSDPERSLDGGNSCVSSSNSCVIYYNESTNNLTIIKPVGGDFSVYKTITPDPKDFSYYQNPTGGGVKTIFTRKIWFEDIKDPENRLGPDGFGMSDDIFGKKAVVEVAWSYRGIFRSAISSVMLYE
jgi:type II secretory pathway pseudopilin PulG